MANTQVASYNTTARPYYFMGAFLVAAAVARVVLAFTLRGEAFIFLFGALMPLIGSPFVPQGMLNKKDLITDDLEHLL